MTEKQRQQKIINGDKGSLERKIKTSNGVKNDDILINDRNSFDFTQ
jgi:hypothetical protein